MQYHWAAVDTTDLSRRTHVCVCEFRKTMSRGVPFIHVPRLRRRNESMAIAVAIHVVPCFRSHTHGAYEGLVHAVRGHASYARN